MNLLDLPDQVQEHIARLPAEGQRLYAGRRLHKHHALDHEEPLGPASTISGDFLMTYDNAVEIRRMAQEHSFDVETVAMTNTHHAVMAELLIGRDLDWCRCSSLG